MTKCISRSSEADQKPDGLNTLANIFNHTGLKVGTFGPLILITLKRDSSPHRPIKAAHLVLSDALDSQGRNTHGHVDAARTLQG